MVNARRFTDDQLKSAIEGASCWADVMEAMGYTRKRPATSAKKRASELNLDVSRFLLAPGSNAPIPNNHDHFPPLMSKSRGIGDNGLPIAMAWFARNGYQMSIPVSGSSPYDLIVESPSHGLLKVQVKTSTNNLSSGAYLVKMTRMEYVDGAYSPRPYTCSEVDYFFITTGNGDMYLIPQRLAEGKQTLSMGNKFENFKVSY